MRWPRRREERPSGEHPERVEEDAEAQSGEYPESFVKGWMAGTLPSTTPAEAARAVDHLRGQGWSEEALAQFILPYMPRAARARPAAAAAPEGPAPAPDVQVPPYVTRQWLDRHLPAMERHELRAVVDELERRGWPAGTVAMAVLPHLLPKLPAEDARAIVAGLADLGMSDAEIARATARR